MKDIRRLVVALVIGSFSIAALLGIVALLGGGDFGDTQGRVLLTTVIVGVESIAVLSYLAVSGRPTAVAGVVGGLVSLVPFALALWLTWGGEDADGLSRTFGISVTVAASLAQICLLLALVARTRIGPALAATLAAIAVVAAMIVLAIVDGSGFGDTYWRLFGVVAILDVLGTVVLTALAVFGHDRPTHEPALLSTALESRVVDAARQRGTTPQQLISDALDSFL